MDKERLIGAFLCGNAELWEYLKLNCKDKDILQLVEQGELLQNIMNDYNYGGLKELPSNIISDMSNNDIQLCKAIGIYDNEIVKGWLNSEI